MNHQEIYDKVKAHLLSQKKKSLLYKGINFFCSYRGAEGLKCAIGTLIPDTKYDRAMEVPGGLRENILVRDCLRSEGINVDDPTTLKFLSALQNVHDSEMPRNWRDRLAKLALNYNLQP